MKECEKWLKKEHIPHQPRGNVIAAQINEARREGWRAALKEVIVHEMNHYGNDFMTDKSMSMLYNFLRKELDGE